MTAVRREQSRNHLIIYVDMFTPDLQFGTAFILHFIQLYTSVQSSLNNKQEKISSVLPSSLNSGVCI